MKLSISNIAWKSEDDEKMYSIMNEFEFRGLEIAPTRIFPQNPYDRLKEAQNYCRNLYEKYKIQISSIQSIWYGRSEKIFENSENRLEMTEYTKKAIDFANVIGCKNLVFGCPKNRVSENENDMETAKSFFKDLGDYAKAKNTVISIEPNPTIYGTNFINNTNEAFELVKAVNSSGFRVNLDFGTIIYNCEDINKICDNIGLVNHIHISEPNLLLIEKRDLHKQLYNNIKSMFIGYISVEMKLQDDLEDIKKAMLYVKEVFA